MNIIILFYLILVTTGLDVFLFKVNIIKIQPSLLLFGLSIIIFFFKRSYLKAYIDKNKIYSNKVITCTFLIAILFFLRSFLFNDLIIITIDQVLLPFFNLYFLISSMLLWSLLNKNKVKIVLGASMIVLCLSILLDTYSNISVFRVSVRGSGISYNPNAAALKIILIYICLSSFYLQRKIIFIVISLVSFFSLFLTLSRGGAILFFIAFFMLFIIHKKITKVNSILILKRLAILSVIILSTYFLYVPITETLYNIYPSKNLAAQTRITQIIGEETIVFNNESRVMIAHYYYDKIKDNPFWGYGTGYTNEVYYGGENATHNVFIKFWVELGIIGFIILVIWNYRLFKHFIIKNNHLGVIFTSIIFLACFLTNTLLDNRTFLSLLGLLFSTNISKYENIN